MNIKVMKSDPNAFANVGFYKSQVLTENDGRPIYTYRFTKGVSDCSHGLLVAKMAGVPDEIIHSAAEFMERTDNVKG
jgi:DNA mismatch repair ATPase MutS